MKALVEKEIRLLLPAFVAALVLAILPVWLLPADPGNGGGLGSSLYLFGMVMLALSSFGRELGLKTVPLILAQPLDRSRIWWTKIAVLSVCAALTYDAWWLSGNVGSLFQPDRSVRSEALASFGLFAVAFMAGSLWLTLLLRQMAAAFWLAILIPMVMVLVLHFIGGGDWVIFSGLGIYAVAAFILAQRQFLRLQDTAWTGGVISLVSRTEVVAGTALRGYRPWGALVRKELRLHEFTLAGIAVLFVLNMGVVAVRKLGAHSFGASTLSALDMFGIVWLFVPLVAGSQSAAEERQLGILDGLLCLPASRRLQFWIKMVFVVIIGGELSCSLLWMIEVTAHGIGITKDFGVLGTGSRHSSAFLVFAALSLIGFYASTLTRNVLQAMGVGVVATVLFWGIFTLEPFFPPWWNRALIPALCVAVIWLSYGNFKWVFESNRRWRRNVLVLSVVFVLTTLFTEAVYYRSWEWGMPVDRLFGPSVLPVDKAATMKGHGGTGLTVVLPDGRLWTDRIAYDRDWISLAGDQFVPGSNWTDAVANARDTVAIRSDGTLWVSEKPRPPWLREEHPPLRELHPLPEPPVPMVRFGDESNWKSVIGFYHPILLKHDGTLWVWGTNDIDGAKYQGLRAITPQRLDASSDWDRIAKGAHFNYGWKRDGSAWAVQAEVLPTNWSNVQFPDLAGFHPRSLSPYPFGMDLEVCVRDDGTLWCWQAPVLLSRVPNASAIKTSSLRLIQIGKDTDWAVVTGGPDGLVALKTDGSLWRWQLKNSWSHPVKVLQEAPQRLGTHSNWIGATCWYGQSVALATDGNIWRLPGSYVDEDGDTGESSYWFAPSRRMTKIENIFDAKE